MRRILLKTRKKNVYLQFYEIDGNGRKTPKEKVKLKQNKHHLVSLPFPFYKMKSYSFPVSELTENKLDLPLWGGKY